MYSYISEISRFHNLQPCESRHFYNYNKSLLLAKRIKYESDDRRDVVDCFYHLNIKNTQYYVSVVEMGISEFWKLQFLFIMYFKRLSKTSFVVIWPLEEQKQCENQRFCMINRSWSQLIRDQRLKHHYFFISRFWQKYECIIHNNTTFSEKVPCCPSKTTDKFV